MLWSTIRKEASHKNRTSHKSVVHVLFIEIYLLILLSESKEHHFHFPCILLGGRFNITVNTVGYEYLSNLWKNSYFLSVSHQVGNYLGFFFYLLHDWSRFSWEHCSLLLLWWSVEMNSTLTSTSISIFWVALTGVSNSPSPGDDRWWWWSQPSTGVMA